jgi:hypothetical protein
LQVHGAEYTLKVMVKKDPPFHSSILVHEIQVVV